MQQGREFEFEGFNGVTWPNILMYSEQPRPDLEGTLIISEEKKLLPSDRSATCVISVQGREDT